MRAISLFSGAGGMDAGFEAAGVDILWANECNTDAVNTYRANHLAAQIEHADIRDAKRLLTRYADGLWRPALSGLLRRRKNGPK